MVFRKWYCLLPEDGTHVPKHFMFVLIKKGRAVALWLRHQATDRQVAGSILDGVTEIFH
jgi:hypothetical protein